MKSTGEVIGFDNNLGSAYAKATLGANNTLPINGTVFMSVNESDKMTIIPIGRDFQEFGFDIIATSGTAKVLMDNGVKCKEIYKVGEGRPNIVDEIKNNSIALIINTPLGKQSRYDEYEIGRAAIKYKVNAITTIEGAQAVVRAVRNVKFGKLNYQSLQDIFNH
tara:strand:- start:23 stop:514 length:492 start_codon:yes stop_codon:yes gene_type:complete